MKYYEKILKARTVLGLSEFATLSEIKQQYHAMMKSVHPDVGDAQPEIKNQKSAEINTAYEIIMEYCERYRISFSEKEVNKYRPAEELWFEKFGDDPTC